MELTIFIILPLILLSVSFCAMAQETGAGSRISDSVAHGLPRFSSAICLSGRPAAGNDRYSHVCADFTAGKKVAVTNETKHNNSNGQIS